MGSYEIILAGAIVSLMFYLASLLITEPVPAPTNWELNPERAAELQDAIEWEQFWDDARFEGAMMFEELFNSYETKWSKNGRLMLRTGSSGPYRFIKAA